MTTPTRARAQAGEAPELSPKEKRALREQARREFKAAERARLAAERAPEDAGTPASAPAPVAAAAAAPPAPPERTDADRARDAALFLRGVLFPLLSILAGVVGYQLTLDKFTEAQAADDAKAWVPILGRYAWLDRLVAAVTLPARTVARVRELARKKEPEAPAAKVVPMREGVQG